MTPRARVFGRVRSAWALLLAAFAMTAMLAIPAHAPARLSPAEQAAVELKATFGELAFLCVQADDDGSSPATPAPHAHDNCPLCQFHAQATGLQAPDLAALPGDCRPSRFARLALASPPPPPTPWPSTSRPRGPPAAV